MVNSYLVQRAKGIPKKPTAASPRPKSISIKNYDSAPINILQDRPHTREVERLINISPRHLRYLGMLI